MAILQFIVFIESGCSPFGLLWALFSTQLIKKTYNAFEIWLLTGLTYILNGLFLELYPGKRIQTKYSLSLYDTFPVVLFNFVSTVLLTFVKLNENVTNEMYGSLYLIAAGIGNELIYAPVHRLLHTSHFYKYHSLHHKQKNQNLFYLQYRILKNLGKLQNYTFPTHLYGYLESLL